MIVTHVDQFSSGASPASVPIHLTEVMSVGDSRFQLLLTWIGLA